MSEHAVEELTERYRRIGGRSPLDELTEAQRAALEAGARPPRATSGMKHWRPRIAEAVEAALAGGAERIVGLVLAPHYSRLSIAGYRSRLEDALAGRAELVFVESWHDHEPFLDVLADRVRGTEAHVVFTAHSLPERILRDGDPYRDQLLETSRLVAERAGLARWSFAFQSASATGEPWLGPDILEELDRLYDEGVRLGARLPDRLRLRPPGDPLGPRRRGARTARRARARARPHPVAERRPRVRRRSRGAGTEKPFQYPRRRETRRDRRGERQPALPRLSRSATSLSRRRSSARGTCARRTSGRSGTCPSRSSPARRSGSSGGTARARRRCCA